MRRAALLAVVAIISVTAATCQRSVPTPLYGVTFDNDGGASTSTLDAQATTLQSLPQMPTVRVVLDEGTKPSDYQPAFTKFNPIAYTQAELLDSSELSSMSAAQYEARARTFVEGLSGVDLWEVGNEVNGSWTGSYAAVAEKVTRAHNVVRSHDAVSVLTLWENTWGPNHCGNGPGEETPHQFSQRLTPAVRSQIAHVHVSWYPTLCKTLPKLANGQRDVRVPVAAIKAELEVLHADYPNARIGFGEIGLPTKVTSGTLSTAQTIATYYYGLDLGLSYFEGGYFWWYGAQDLVPTSKPMFATIADAMA